MPFIDIIKNAIFEEEPHSNMPAKTGSDGVHVGQATNAPASLASSAPSNAAFNATSNSGSNRAVGSSGATSTARASASAPDTSSGSTSGASNDNQFYVRLAKQTDPSAVPELAKIESFAAPLAGIIPDKSMRYKAALATAQSQGGLTREAVLRAFDSLMVMLNSSSMTFKRQSEEIGKTEVDGKLAQIDQMSAVIADKEKEIANLKEQMKAAQAQAEAAGAKLQRAKANFQAAFERRKAEIEQQRQEFENILQ